MIVQALAIPEVKLITPTRHADARGYFSETYNARALRDAGVDVAFVQDNESLSRPAGVVRGLHFQIPPFAQAKLVRVVKGRVFDVAVDIRVGAPTYGRHVTVELDGERGEQVLVPEGFAHGLMTLVPDTVVAYKVSDFYAPDHDRGILWNDPELGIPWPMGAGRATVSDRDVRQPRFRDLDPFFPA